MPTMQARATGATGCRLARHLGGLANHHEIVTLLAQETDRLPGALNQEGVPEAQFDGSHGPVTSLPRPHPEHRHTVLARGNDCSPASGRSAESGGSAEPQPCPVPGGAIRPAPHWQAGCPCARRAPSNRARKRLRAGCPVRTESYRAGRHGRQWRAAPVGPLLNAQDNHIEAAPAGPLHPAAYPPGARPFAGAAGTGFRIAGGVRQILDRDRVASSPAGRWTRSGSKRRPTSTMNPMARPTASNPTG